MLKSGSTLCNAMKNLAFLLMSSIPTSKASFGQLRGFLRNSRSLFWLVAIISSCFGFIPALQIVILGRIFFT